MTRLPYLPDPIVEQILRHCDEPTRDRTMLASKNMKVLTDRARREDYAQAALRPGRFTQEALPTHDELVQRKCSKPHRAHVAKTWEVGPSGPTSEGPSAGLYRGAAGVAAAKVCGFTHSESSSSGASYDGGFKDGAYHGFGVKNFGDGRHYEGGYKAGKLQGYGVLTYAEGAYYEGGFQAGSIHGSGLYVWASGKRYEGGLQVG